MNAVSDVPIGVCDMERSLRFYRDLLRLEVMSEWTAKREIDGSLPPNATYGRPWQTWRLISATPNITLAIIIDA